jgi:hypothetical protein
MGRSDPSRVSPDGPKLPDAKPTRQFALQAAYLDTRMPTNLEQILSLSE